MGCLLVVSREFLLSEALKSESLSWEGSDSHGRRSSLSLLWLDLGRLGFVAGEAQLLFCMTQFTVNGWEIVIIFR